MWRRPEEEPMEVIGFIDYFKSSYRKYSHEYLVYISTSQQNQVNEVAEVGKCPCNRIILRYLLLVIAVFSITIFTAVSGSG